MSMPQQRTLLNFFSKKDKVNDSNVSRKTELCDSPENIKIREGHPSEQAESDLTYRPNRDENRLDVNEYEVGEFMQEVSNNPNDDKRNVDKSLKNSKNRPRAIQKYWFEKFPWLEVNSNNSILSCSICKMFPNLQDRNSKLVTGHTTPFKIETLRIHEASKSHRNCRDADLAKKSPASTPLAESILRASKQQIEQMSIYFNTAYYLAFHSKPLEEFKSQLELLKKLNVPVKDCYANRTECTVFVKCISTCIRNEIIQDITNSVCGTLLLDGSTDAANQSCVVVYMRYIKNSEVKESFLCIELLPSETAQGYFEAITCVLERLEIPLKTPGWLVGLGTDGAATMIGEKGGLGAKLMQIYPQLVQVHCVAHRLQLAVLDACSKVDYVGICEKNVRAIFKFYNSSPKRLRELSHVATLLESKILKLTDLNSIRWVVSKRRTLEALLKSWHPLVVHLENCSTSSHDGPLAKGILRFMTCHRYVKFCHFLLDFLNVYAPVSLVFQKKKKIVITQVENAVQSAILKLQKLCETPGSMESQFISNYKEGKFHSILLTNTTNGETSFRTDRQKILEHGQQYLKFRFEGTKVSIVHAMRIFDTATWPTGRKLAEFGNNEILQLAEHFKLSLPLYGEDQVLDEWYDLKQVSTDLPFDTLCKHSINQSARFPLLSRLMSIIICIPVSTASCERGFSAMNNIKTTYRARLSLENTDHLMNIRINGPPVPEFDPLPSVHHWFSTTARRPRF